MTIPINDKLFDSLFEEDYQAVLDSEVRGEAERVRLQALTGSRKSPLERATEFASDPVGNIIEPTAAALTDVGSGAITGLAGVAQASSTLQETARQGYNWLIGTEYTDAEKEEFISRQITDPELARQQAYADYRQKVSDRKPSELATLVGEVLPTMLVNPKKAAEGAFGKVIQAIGYGGLSGSMEFVENGVNERAMNALTGVATGGLFDIAQQVLTKGVRVLKEAFRPSLSDFAQTDKIDISEKLSTSDVKKVVEAARRLGITVTPAEASGSSLLIHGQNTLDVNTASREQLSEFLRARNDSLTENILSLQKAADQDLQYSGTIFTQTGSKRPKAPFVSKVDEVRWKKTRETVYRQSLEPEQLKAVFGSSPMLAKVHNDYVKALKKPSSKRTNEDVLNITAFDELKAKLGIEGDMPINNVGYLDMLITNLDQLLDKASEGTTKAARDRNAISRQRKALSGVLKRNVEGYESLKAQQQRAIAVSNLQNAVDDVSVPLADRPKAFFNNVLANKQKREELLRQLETVPEAKKKVEDLTLVLSHIFGDADLSKLISNSEKDLLQVGGGGLGPTSALALKFQQFMRNDSGLINVITNPQWTSDISKLKGRTPPETLQNVTSFLSRVVNTSDKIETALGVKEQARQDLSSQMLSTDIVTGPTPSLFSSVPQQ
tara:strand:+ start:1234 stop:3231 length:1998 start_codon:yes stop_codon:yes gene_type:complete